jgi:hypothetical protein
MADVGEHINADDIDERIVGRKLFQIASERDGIARDVDDALDVGAR